MKKILLIIFILFQINLFAQQKDTAKTLQKPKLVSLDLSSNNFQPIFKGYPETSSIKSGFVTLKAGESVGEHSTESNEEMIVVLEGQCELIIGNKKLKLQKGIISYCPAHTKHNVKNIGKIPVKYIYIVAKVQN
jgi:Mannose-6-phosphate isomerase